MNRLPVPHPESSEILRQQDVIDAHLKIGELITAAAEGAGNITPLRSEQVNHSYTAHDYSENPRFRNGMGGIVRDVDAFNAGGRFEVLTPDGGRVVAETIHNVVGKTYPLDISKSYRRFGPSGELIDVVTIQLGWNGDYYEPKVMVSKLDEEARELKADEELDVKTQIANAFGLHFELRPRQLSQQEDISFEVAPESKQIVDSLAAELTLEGFTGYKLRTKLLKELHPDRNPEHPEFVEAFKYAASLNYENTYRLVRARTVPNSDNKGSSKAA